MDPKVLLDGDRNERTGQAHPDTNRPREEDHKCSVRGHGSGDSEDADEKDRASNGGSRPEAGSDVCGRGCEETHAQNWDSPKQTHDRMGRLQRVLDSRQKRPDADDLRPKR